MNRPFVSVVVAYVAGVLLAQVAHPPLAVLASIFAIVFLLVLFVKTLRAFLIWPLLLLAGWGHFEARTAILSPNDLRTKFGNEPANVTLRGRLAETPRLKIIVIDGVETWHSIVRIRTSEVSLDGQFQPVAGEVLATAPDVLGTNFFAGQSVEISGTIGLPAGPLAAGMFDYRKYLAAHGIYYQLKTRSMDDWQLREPVSSSPPLTDRFLAWSQRTLAYGLPQEDQPLRLLWAMTLGWRTAFTGDVGDPFLRAGTINMYTFNGMV